MAVTDAAAEMPMPVASVAYTRRMCATTPSERLSYCEPACCCLCSYDGNVAGAPAAVGGASLT